MFDCHLLRGELEVLLGQAVLVDDVLLLTSESQDVVLKLRDGLAEMLEL